MLFFYLCFYYLSAIHLVNKVVCILLLLLLLLLLYIRSMLLTLVSAVFIKNAAQTIHYIGMQLTGCSRFFKVIQSQKEKVKSLIFESV